MFSEAGRISSIVGLWAAAAVPKPLPKDGVSPASLVGRGFWAAAGASPKSAMSDTSASPKPVN